MNNVCNIIYDSSLFDKNKKTLIKEGKTKEQILDIIKDELTSDSFLNKNKLSKIVKRQILEIFKDELGGDISDAICSIFKCYYAQQPSKLKDHFSLFKDFCNANADVCLEEMIMTLFMNVETRAATVVNENIEDFMNQFSNKLWVDYFKKNDCQQKIFDESLKRTKTELEKLNKNLNRIDNIIKNQAKSNVEFTRRIVTDILNSKTKEFEFILKDFENKLTNTDFKFEKTEIDKIVLDILKSKKDFIVNIIKENKDVHLNSKINELEKKVDLIIKNNNKDKQFLLKKIDILGKDKNEILNRIEQEKKILFDKIKHLRVNYNNANDSIKKLMSENKILKEENSDLKKDYLKQTELISDLQINYQKYDNNITKINDTIKSITNQIVQKDVQIFEEIDKKIEEKTKIIDSIETINKMKIELLELRAQIDLIYRNRQSDMNIQPQHFYNPHQMY